MKNLYKLSAIALLTLSLHGQDAQAIYDRFVLDMTMLAMHRKSAMRFCEGVCATSGSADQLPHFCRTLEELDDDTRRRVLRGAKKSLTLAQYLGSAALYRVHHPSDKAVHYTALYMPLLAHYGLVDPWDNKIKPEIGAIARKNAEILTISRDLLFSEGQ